MRSTRRITLLAGFMAGTALLTSTACGAGVGADEGGKVPVIASFYPMAWLAERVGGSHIGVTTLTKPGAEPHDLELTPRQVIEVSQSRLVVYVKGVQPAVDRAVDEQARDHMIDAAALVKSLPAVRDQAGEHESGQISYDPHMWLDPSRLATVATAVGDRLAKVDPRNAADYHENAAGAATELSKLDTEFRTALGHCRRTTIVTSHAAFGHLADRYRLKQVPIAGLDPDVEPSPKRLTELAGQIRQTRTTTVFTETLLSPKVAQTLAREANVKTAKLDPIEGLAPGSHDDYLSLMRVNLGSLRAGLECK